MLEVGIFVLGDVCSYLICVGTAGDVLPQSWQHNKYVQHSFVDNAFYMYSS